MRIKQLAAPAALADVSLAALSSVVTVLGTIAFAAMIFSGLSPKAVPLAFLSFVAGTALSGLFIALFSQFQCNLSGAQDEPAAILAIFGSGLASMGVVTEAAAVSTMFTVIVLSTACFGLVLLILGALRWGKYTQLIPYPVVGGFLAGVGLMLLTATIEFLSGVTVTMHRLPQFFSWEMILRWLPSVIAASILYGALVHIRSVLFLPFGLICILILFYLVTGTQSISLELLRKSGLVFTSIPQDGVFEASKLVSLASIEWNLVLHAWDEIPALILVCTIGASLATTALEIGAEVELEPNHELRTHGLANLLSALVGGLPAFSQAGPSLTYLRLGASSRWMPILRALFTVILGAAGLSLLGYVPKMVVGTLLILFAFALMHEWLIRARYRLGLTDYIFVLIIAGIIEIAGFLPGVGAGILIAAADFLIQYSKLNFIKVELSGREYRSDVERPLHADKILRETGGRIITFEIQGFIFFGTAVGLLERIRASVRASAQKVDYVILGFANVDGLDAAAHFALRKLHNFAKAENICLLFSGLSKPNAKALQAANIIDKEQSLCFANTAMAVEFVENQLLKPFIREEASVGPEETLVEVLGDRDKALALLPYFKFYDIRAGDQVFSEGDNADFTILLVRGNLSAHLDLGGAQQVRLRKFLPGTLVGEMAFYTGTKRSAAVVADTDATIGVISAESILRLNQDQPAAAVEFHQMAARVMANRIISMNATLRILLAGLTIPNMLDRAGDAAE